MHLNRLAELTQAQGGSFWQLIKPSGELITKGMDIFE